MKGPDNIAPTSETRTDGRGDFPARLAEIIGESSVRAFARKAGVSDTFLRQCLAGRTEPTRLKLLALAEAGAVTVEWLATGGGSRGAATGPQTVAPPQLDRDLLAAAITAVEEALRDTGRMLTPERKALLVTAAYELQLDKPDRGPVSPDDVVELVARAE